jgi:hypothetical protein
MLTQLTHPIPLITPKGKAWAVAIIDYGPQWDLQWITFVHQTGECWTFRNSQVRQDSNFTFGIGEPSPIQEEELNPLTMRPFTQVSPPATNG